MLKQNKKQSSSFSEKLKNFTRMLCASQQSKPKKQKDLKKQKGKSSKNYNNNNKVNIPKKPRNKFVFQNTLIKLSRRNVGQQQFFQNQILTLQLETYLAQRINKCITTIMKGQFTLSIYKKLIKPMILRQKPFISQEENKLCDVICTAGYCIRIRENQSIDLGLFQLYDGQQRTDEFMIIQNIFKQYHKTIKHFGIICSKNVKLQQYTQLFKLYSHQFIFDVERVMQNQKLVCNIIWASPQLKFLRIQKDCLVDFYVERLTLFKTQHKIAQQLLGKLIDLGFHLTMSRVLLDIQTVRNKIDDLFKAFVFQLYSKQEKARQSILEYFEVDHNCPQTPKLLDFTPGFHYTSNQKHFKEEDTDL